jgi:hypothetical protein
MGALMFLNVLLLVCLLGTLGTAGAYAFLPNFRSMLPLPQVASVATSLPPTSAPVGNATQAPVQATTAPVAAGEAITCNGIDQARAFFDCTVTNPGNPDSINLIVKPLQSDVQGFFYSVSLNGQNVQPVTSDTPGETWFNLGNLSAGESKPVRVSVACVAASGCNTTAFVVSVMGSDAETPLGNVQVMSPP